jgi:hypothetical protein
LAHGESATGGVVLRGEPAAFDDCDDAEGLKRLYQCTQLFVPEP